MAEITSDSSLAIQFFPTFEARRGTAALSGLHRREGNRLLAYLVLRAGEPVSSWELAKRFWPSATRNVPSGQGDFPVVRQALNSLRQALGEDTHRLKRVVRSSVVFDASGVEIDVLHFDRLVRVEGEESWSSYEKAVAIYRGPLLSDWDDEWVLDARRRRRRDHENVLRRLAQQARQEGQSTAAERWTRSLIASQPGDEEAWRDLLRLLSTLGRHAEVQETLQAATEAALAAGKAFSPDTTALAEELRRLRESEPLILQDVHLPTVVNANNATPADPDNAGDATALPAITNIDLP